MITLDKFKYFLEVARLEHVGLASKSLRISASAISSAITSIENEYQCKLFERSHQRIYLNDKGRWLKEELMPILEQLESLSQKATQNESSYKGHINAGGSIFLANHYLQKSLFDVQKKNSDISIEISPLRSIQVVEEIIKGDIDYGLCISPSGHPNLVKKSLYSGSLNIVVAKHHPLVKKIKNKTFNLSLLNDYPAAIHKFSPGINYQETKPFQQFGIQPQIKNYYHSEDLAIQSVLHQNYWAVVPDLVFSHYQTKIVSVPLPRDWAASYEVCSVYRKTFKDRPLFLHLDQLLEDALKKTTF